MSLDGEYERSYETRMRHKLDSSLGGNGGSWLWGEWKILDVLGGEVLDVNPEIRLTLWAFVRLASSGVAHCLAENSVT